MPTLEWIGKDKVINHHQEVPFRVLERRYSYDEAGQHDADNGSENMIIRGDNLEALKALLPRYEGRVKCIYIDPPYNTGNEGWVYNDNVNDPRIKKWLGEVVGKEGEDLTRHDKWLCMMYPRLKLLQRLLADDGIIFISIDENEQANLKQLCDEIFGASNYRTMISWRRKYSVSNNFKGIATICEYILVYSKSEKFQNHLLPRSADSKARYSNPDNDPRGPWKTVDYLNQATPSQRPNLCYDIINPFTGDVIKNTSKAWKYEKSTHERHVAENRIWWGIDGTNTTPALKLFLSEVRDGMTPHNWWSYEEVGHTQEATNELVQIFGKKSIFDYPKPTRLIERILQIASDPDSIILDSFAGSGTTAHAVLNMNKVDGGHRKFILVEMMDYADSITAERVKRVIQGYGDGKKAVEGTGGSFSFYDLGEPLLIGECLNESVGTEKIREYVWFMETRAPYAPATGENPYYLGTCNDTGYYFYYEPEQVTVLDYPFLSTITEKSGSTVIYADRCSIGADKLAQMGIVFKKIPRDISRL